MPDPRQLSPGAVEIPDPQVFEGVIATDASAVDEEVYVTIPYFDDGEGKSWKHGPCKWMPRAEPGGLFFPKRGDPCIVELPTGGDPWISIWMNQASTPDHTWRDLAV